MKNENSPKEETTALVVINGVELSEANHAQIGAELTRYYHEAKAAELLILRFGAAYWAVERNLSTCGQVSGGRGNKGGFSDWLRKNAPEITRSTAIRFRDLAKAIAEKFQIENPVLLFTANPEELTDAEKKTRENVIKFVSEKSVRSLQEELGLSSPPEEKTGKNTDPTTGKRKHFPTQKSPADLEAARIAQQQENFRETFGVLVQTVEEGCFAALEDEEAEKYAAAIKDLHTKLYNEVILPRRQAQAGAKHTRKARDISALTA